MAASEHKALVVTPAELKDLPPFELNKEPIVSFREIPFEKLIDAFLKNDFNATSYLEQREEQAYTNSKDHECRMRYLHLLEEKEKKENLLPRELSLAARFHYKLSGTPEMPDSASKALSYVASALAGSHPDPDAQITLGLMHCDVRWRGFERDVKEAVKLFQLASAQGHHGAEYHLGLSFLWGEGVEKNIEQALYHFAQAAKKDHVEALHCVAVIFSGLHGVYKPDDKKAFLILKRAAEGGSKYATVWLGDWFHKGRGMEAVGNEWHRHGEAAKWFRYAAFYQILGAQLSLHNVIIRPYWDPKKENTCKHPIIFFHYLHGMYPSSFAKRRDELDAYYAKAPLDDVTLYQAATLFQTPKLRKKCRKLIETKPDLFVKVSYHEPREIFCNSFKDEPELVDAWDRYLLKFYILNERLSCVLINTIFSFLKSPHFLKPLPAMLGRVEIKYGEAIKTRKMKQDLDLYIQLSSSKDHREKYKSKHGQLFSRAASRQILSGGELLNLGIYFYANKEYSKAIYYFNHSSKKNNPNASYFLGLMYEQGHAISASDDNEAEAIACFQRAAELGNPYAVKKLSPAKTSTAPDRKL